MANIRHIESGAGEGNRTPVVSLGSCCSTIELHPRAIAHCHGANAPSTDLALGQFARQGAAVHA